MRGPGDTVRLVIVARPELGENSEGIGAPLVWFCKGRFGRSRFGASGARFSTRPNLESDILDAVGTGEEIDRDGEILKNQLA